MKRAVNTTPFDRSKVPPRQNILLLPLIWLVCWLITRLSRLKVRRIRMRGLKPPFIVLATHHSFADFYVTPLALFPHRANYVSELEGFEHYGEWLYRQIGCLGTRKYVSDLALIRNIERVIARGDILVLYPEARYANVGTSSTLPVSVGKLAKRLGVPVVALNMHGNYLKSPIWSSKDRRGVRLEANIEQIFSKKELEAASAETVRKRIQQALTYDEYAWQKTHGYHIPCPKRAEGLEEVLYRCPICETKFTMQTKGAELFCTQCGSRWQMTTLGEIQPLGSRGKAGKAGKAPLFTHIPDWYEWQRKQVQKEIDCGKYHLETRVHIEALPNAINFIDLGEGLLTHTPDGFELNFTEYGHSTPSTLRILAATLSSVHTEYNFRKRGHCITLSTLDNTYFIFPIDPGFNVTKIQFATEYFHERSRHK